MKKSTLILIAALLLCGSISAKITLPPVIGDNMVLQQQTDAALFGKAAPGKTVTVKTSWDKKKYSAKADSESGKWLLRVKTPAAGGPYEITISDGEKLTLHDVLIGEVWFASGQSNMEMPVRGYGSQPAKDGVKYITAAKASRPIRICNIKKQSSLTVQDSCGGQWFKHTPNAVAECSATAYFFADALQGALDIPVGIIVSSWGGSSIETWMKREVFEKEFPNTDLGHLDGKRPVKRNYHDPCLLYNGQVAPLIPFTFKGMIWYQGEQNRPNPNLYVKQQQAYVKMMREDFQVPDAPFYLVQIAPYTYDNGRKTHSGYFCEAQQKAAQSIPNAGYVTTVDIGEHGTIHPSHKQEVGQRLALLALSNDYGFDAIEAWAPYYKIVQFREGKAFVQMKVGNLGLSPLGAEISGFEIAGADRKFVDAKAMRDPKKGDNVIVWSDEVPEPVAVRYCWRNWSVGGLYNNFGIPAGPFRTDDWPVNPKDWE
ncbi:MAG: sialate O-acetylesterase [Bacteroidales bacterium]|nr:sialate O-acetylesterase [Bacteroidales bacterium]